MRHTFTEALIQESEWIPADEKEIILFGLQQGKSMVNSILITLAIGIIMNLFWESVLFVICFFPVKKIRRRISCKNTIKVYGDFNFSNYNGIFAVKDNMLDEMVDCALQCRMFLHYLFHSACRK